MEPYLVWPKPKQSMSSYLQPKSNPSWHGDSWEERAFAEDTVGVLGGSVWPPRSYPCTFCRREFRSAQALGGHMNIHRRDRARQNLSPNTTHGDSVIHQDNQNPIPNPIPPWNPQHPSGICAMVYNPYSTSQSDHVFFPPQASSVSRVSLSPHPKGPKHKIRDEKTMVPLPPPPIIKEHDHNKPSIHANPPSWSNEFVEKYFRVSNSHSNGQGKNSVSHNAPGDLSISLNLVVHRAHLMSSGGKEREDVSSKRRMIDSVSFPFFPKPNSGKSHENVESEVVVEGSSSTTTELDLELRLG